VNIALSYRVTLILLIIFLQQHPLDVQYFDKAFTAERAKLTPVQKEILQSMDQTQFQGFSYTNPNATD
jgi:novel protein kinase C delta type